MSVNRSNIAEHLMDYQLKMIGKTRMDVVDDDRWFFNFTMTQQQLLEFRKYAIPLLQKVFHFRKEKAELVFQSFRDLFGVRIKG